MTPYAIEILLWYYARVADHPNVDDPPPIWKETLAMFLCYDLLTPSGVAGPPSCLAKYQLTDRGSAYVHALMRVPFPEQRWVTTWPKDEVA